MATPATGCEGDRIEVMELERQVGMSSRAGQRCVIMTGYDFVG
jgi:hypothetical protein